MSYQIHPQARTTPKVREEIKASLLSPAQLAKNITSPSKLRKNGKNETALKTARTAL